LRVRRPCVVGPSPAALGVPVTEQFVEWAYLLENLRRGPLGRLKKDAPAG